MKSISEARELRKRINAALQNLIMPNDEAEYVELEDSTLLYRFDALRTIMVIMRNELDAMIEEWDAERGIDRPL